MLGYMDNEEANKTTFDKDGWMRSGDIGYYDTEGFVFIVDRMKELIKVKGLQESCAVSYIGLFIKIICAPL